MTLGITKVSSEAAEIEARPAATATFDALPGHLARELHDQVAQPLISLVLDIHDLAAAPGLDRQTAADLRRLENSVRRVLRNARELLVDLRGQGEIRLNFREVLKNELIRTSLGRGETPPALQVSTSWPRHINGWAAFNLLRIIQEAVANAQRHGRAGRVDIILSTSSEGEAVIVVVDDGGGIGDSPSGIGMVGMKERAVILGGRFSAVPRLDGGTRVEVRIPLQRLA